MIRVKKGNSYQKGLSLIEVLIGVVLSSLIMLALLTLYIAGQKYFFNQGAKADTIQDSSYPSEWISRDIRGAIQVVSSHDFGEGNLSTSDEILILEIPSIDEDESIVSGFDYIVYQLNDNRLERKIDADEASFRTDSTRVLADDVSSIAFLLYASNGGTPTSYEESFNVHFEITSTKTSIGRGGKPYQETFRSWAKIRSKAFE